MEKSDGRTKMQLIFVLIYSHYFIQMNVLSTLLKKEQRFKSVEISAGIELRTSRFSFVNKALILIIVFNEAGEIYQQ